MIKGFSLVALTTLVMVGCGGTGTKSTSTFVQKNAKAVSVSALKNLGDTNTVTTKSLKSAGDSASKTFAKRENENNGSGMGLCESGTLDIGNTGSNAFSIDASSCVNGTTTINGALNATVNESAKTGSAEVTRDFSVIEDIDNIFIVKGSKLSIENETIKADFSTKINGALLSADNLQAIFSEDGDNTSLSFTSGVVNVAGYYFEFVSQDVPFSGTDSLTAGKLTLKDGAGHKVLIEVESADSVALKIDENGDGVFSESEILRDSLN